nr:MAG TPA: hypothetical protein [Caudoviricetes sp.]
MQHKHFTVDIVKLHFLACVRSRFSQEKSYEYTYFH